MKAAAMYSVQFAGAAPIRRRASTVVHGTSSRNIVIRDMSVCGVREGGKSVPWTFEQATTRPSGIRRLSPEATYQEPAQSISRGRELGSACPVRYTHCLNFEAYNLKCR